MSNRRIVFGNRTFIPTGKPVQIGSLPRRKRRLGDIEEYGPSRRITIVIGQNKGKQKQNQTGRCALKPKRFSVADVDHEFFRIRENQVGRKVAGTRVAGRGWYEGSPEASISYEVSYVPPAGGGPPEERTYKDFQRNIDRVAERLAETFCQDSVLIVRDDGQKRSVAGATWKPRRRSKR